MPAGHFGQGGVPIGGARVPVKSMPLGAQELAEGVADRKADANPVGTEPLDGRRTQVLWLADSHGARA